MLMDDVTSRTVVQGTHTHTHIHKSTHAHTQLSAFQTHSCVMSDKPGPAVSLYVWTWRRSLKSLADNWKRPDILSTPYTCKWQTTFSTHMNGQSWFVQWHSFWMCANRDKSKMSWKNSAFCHLLMSFQTCFLPWNTREDKFGGFTAYIFLMNRD